MEGLLFTLKKVASIYLNPITIGLEIIVVGVLMLAFSRRKPKKQPKPFWKKIKRAAGDLGLFVITFGIFFIYLCTIDPVANSLMYSLEKRFVPLSDVDQPDFARRFETPPKHVVVLAGGARYHENKAPTSQLKPASMARVLEGVRLHRNFPEASFIVTGRPDETQGMAELAITFGVPEGRIIQETESRDTKDHPVFLETLVGNDPFLLVTSATHMPRSHGLFKGHGFDPIAAPCDFWVWPEFSTFDLKSSETFVPRVVNIYKIDLVFHEFLGLAWAKIRKQTEHSEEEESSEPIPVETSDDDTKNSAPTVEL